MWKTWWHFCYSIQWAQLVLTGLCQFTLLNVNWAKFYMFWMSPEFIFQYWMKKIHLNNEIYNIHIWMILIMGEMIFTLFEHSTLSLTCTCMVTQWVHTDLKFWNQKCLTSVKCNTAFFICRFYTVCSILFHSCSRSTLKWNVCNFRAKTTIKHNIMKIFSTITQCDLMENGIAICLNGKNTILHNFTQLQKSWIFQWYWNWLLPVP